MVTNKTSNGQTNKYYGLSTDTKPANVPNASSFYEMDTGEYYLYDASGHRWIKQ